jgi:hypothetical protein
MTIWVTIRTITKYAKGRPAPLMPSGHYVSMCVVTVVSLLHIYLCLEYPFLPTK